MLAMSIIKHHPYNHLLVVLFQIQYELYQEIICTASDIHSTKECHTLMDSSGTQCEVPRSEYLHLP